MTGASAKNYDKARYAQLSVTYTTADGTSVSITEPTVQSRSITDVADSILVHSDKEAEKTYATGIKDAFAQANKANE